MYNPVRDDFYYEWVEVYNAGDETVNLSGFRIRDNYEEDFIEPDFDHGDGSTLLPPGRYALITDHQTMVYSFFNISNETIRLYVDDKNIGNGLGNQGDKIVLMNKNGEALDGVEWGFNYDDVPGYPAEVMNEGNSLARYHFIDSDNTSDDFFECVNPTPGCFNVVKKNWDLKIDLFPWYLPKATNDSEFSVPFAIKVNLTGFSENNSFKMKAYVTGDVFRNEPATQTWNGSSWVYSGFYTHKSITNGGERWEKWVYLRFKKSYKEYLRNIMNNKTAYLVVKIKRDDGGVISTREKIELLDMDKSTTNGTKGGYIIGRAVSNNSYLENKTVIVENNDRIVGIYKTEDNNISEDENSYAGYFKVSAPVGPVNIVKIINKNRVLTFENVTVEQGQYSLRITCDTDLFFIRKNETMQIPIVVVNQGDFNDTVKLGFIKKENSLGIGLGKENVTLKPGGSAKVFLTVKNKGFNIVENTTLTVYARSEGDMDAYDEVHLNFEPLGPELFFKNIETQDSNRVERRIFGQGELIWIKTCVKNRGNENAADVNISFYYDSFDRDHLIGFKKYENIGKFQKYPSTSWDTYDVKPGEYTILATFDLKNKEYELNSSNNIVVLKIKLFNTTLNQSSRKVLITEIYYHTHPGLKDEYVKIFNPTSEKINISHWYISNNPFETMGKQNKIVFQDNTFLPPYSALVVTEEACDYYFETGIFPDFEYLRDSTINVSDMKLFKSFVMSNKGGVVALKDRFNHTVDMVVYGDMEINSSDWGSRSVPSSGEGVVLTRVFNDKNEIVDTNSYHDWVNPRRYRIGQSRFQLEKFEGNGSIEVFVSPDCAYETIVKYIRDANSSIYINMYEFTSVNLCEELVSALQRNISVYVLSDGSPAGGISELEEYVFNRLTSYGGEVRLLKENVNRDIYKRYVFNHGKYVIIDNKTLIIESCNWVPTGVPVNPGYGNREWGICIQCDPLVEYVKNVFFEDWDSRRADVQGFTQPKTMSFDKTFLSSLSEEKQTWGYKPCFENKKFFCEFTAIPVLSPDTSLRSILELLESAEESIYVEQLYIYLNWTDGEFNPLVDKLVEKAEQDVDVKIVLNINPFFSDTNKKNVAVKKYLEKHNISVKLLYVNWSYFTNVHNKGVVVDNRSVLIGSINWNENSLLNNREMSVIIENKKIAEYFSNVFLFDYRLKEKNEREKPVNTLNTFKINMNTVYISFIYLVTFVLIAKDWRNRKWT